MKRLIMLGTLFMLPLILVLYVLGLVWADVYGERALLYTRNLQEVSKTEELDVLVFGDSHALSALAEDSLPKSVRSTARGMESYRDILLKLLYLGSLGNNPATVVLEIDPHMFSAYRSPRNNRTCIQQAVPYSLYSSVYPTAGPRSLMDRLTPYFPMLDMTYRNQLSTYLFEKLKRMVLPAIAETETDDTPWAQLTQQRRESSARGRANTQFGEDGLNHEMADAFERILAYCSENSISVVAIRLPATAEYLQAIETASAEIGSYLEGFAFDGRFDYSRLYAEQPDLFTNEDHLNAQGAAQFTKRLLEDLAASGFMSSSKETLLHE